MAHFTSAAATRCTLKNKGNGAAFAQAEMALKAFERVPLSAKKCRPFEGAATPGGQSPTRRSAVTVVAASPRSPAARSPQVSLWTAGGIGGIFPPTRPKKSPFGLIRELTVCHCPDLGRDAETTRAEPRARPGKKGQAGRPALRDREIYELPAIVCRRRRGSARVPLLRSGAGIIDPGARRRPGRIRSVVEGKWRLPHRRA